MGSRTTYNKEAFKGSLCIVFIVENTFCIVVYFIMGIISGTACLNAIKLTLVMVIGLFWRIKIFSSKIVKKLLINIIRRSID